MKTYQLFIENYCPNCLFGTVNCITEFNSLKRETINQGYSPKSFIKIKLKGEV